MYPAHVAVHVGDRDTGHLDVAPRRGVVTFCAGRWAALERVARTWCRPVGTAAAEVWVVAAGLRAPGPADAYFEVVRDDREESAPQPFEPESWI